MKTVALSLLIFIAPITIHAQSSMKTVLANVAGDQTELLPDDLNAYADGKYKEAFNLLQTSEAEQIPQRSRFLTYALLYQRNYDLVREAFKSGDDQIDIPETYKFYTNHPEVSAELDGETTLPVNNTRFKAVLGTDTLTVLLDTGGSGVGIDQTWVETYDLPFDSTISSGGSLPFIDNATFTKHPVMIPELRIGSMTLKNVPAEYSKFDEENQKKLDAVDLPHFDIIMGLDTFIGLIGEVELNWIDETITFRQEPTLTEGVPFLFYSSKPFTAFSVDDQHLTTLIDTGSPTDMIRKEYYMNNYTKAEEKTYNQYTYTEYTVPIVVDDGTTLDLKIGDYTGGIDLTISDVPVELLIGFNHDRMIFNLVDNLLIVQ